jgi:hypothetical protein
MRPVLALALLAAFARADDIYGKQGSKPFVSDVKVISEDDKVVYIDKSLKERSFAKDMVGRIEKKRSDVHECLDMLDAAKDADAMVAAAKWAEERKFGKPAVESIYERALELDPRNAAANTALGSRSARRWTTRRTWPRRASSATATNGSRPRTRRSSTRASGSTTAAG